MLATPSRLLTSRPSRLSTLLVGVAGGFLLAAGPLGAGGTPATGAITDQLQTMGGGGAEPGVGDAVSSYLTTTGGNSTVGLDEPYDYYIEVPEGQTRLVVEIFDADVNAGGTADDLGERDQNRTSAFNTKARYRLFDPAGNLVATRFTYGDDATTGGVARNPPASDNVWKIFFDADTAGITGGDTFADDFSSGGSYANNSGSVNFAGPWTEANDLGAAGGAGAGDVQVTGGRLVIHNRSASSPFSNEPRVSRPIGDLTGYVAAEISFDYEAGSGVDKINAGSNLGDSIAFEISSNGGTSWTILEEFASFTGGEIGSALYDITDFLSADVRVRFRITNRYAGANEEFRVDDFQVRAVTSANSPDPANGHWRVEVDMSGNVNGQIIGGNRASQNDVNAFGLRAHDGNAAAGGQELNVYAESFVIVGINDNDRGRDYVFYPYVTQGCTARVQDFDFDADQSNPPAPNPNTQPYGSLDLTSRSGSFTHSNSTMSDNDAWNDEPVSTWSTDDEADDYGIWQMDVRIEDWNDNNYGPIYLASSEASPPPPTGNPEPDTYRLYFPTDANGAPSKPYLSQYLTYVPGQSASTNPPASGETSRYTVSLVVTNPANAIGDISFDTTDVVTANVPGGGVVYGGVAFLTDGSVVSEPSIGGTGDVTWNPGTLAPGDEATLAYFIDITGTGSDQLATGASGSGDGTRATFLDETRDATNARATYTFGELCELSVVTAPPTQVMITDVSARESAGATVVEWSTAAEAGTALFEVLRVEEYGRAERVHADALVALLGHPQGGVYRLVDETVRAGVGDSLTYVIRETETSGRRRDHGPYTVTVGTAPRDVEPAGGFDRRPHPATRRARADEVPAGSVRAGKTNPLRPTWPDAADVPALRLEVDETGLYRVDLADLAEGFGLDLPTTRRLLARRALRLAVDDETVAWRVVGRAEGIEFVGLAFDGPFDDRNVYRLTIDRGERMPEPRPETLPADWDAESFRDLLHAEDATLPLVRLPLDPESDLWYWGFVKAASADAVKTFAVDVPAVADTAAGADAELVAHLQGALPGDHDVVVRWAGRELGQVRVEGLETASFTFSLPAADIVEGTNLVEIEAVGGDGKVDGLVFVDSFDLSFDRPYRPLDGRLLVRGPSPGVESAAPFGGPGRAAETVHVFDLTDPNRPVPLAVRVLAEADGTRALWRATGDAPRLAVAESAVRAPAIFVDHPSDLRAAENAAEWLAIAPADLIDAVEPLADRRRAQGLVARTVDLQDIYDEFTHGRRDPRALRDFLAHAHATWQTPPRHVLLVGSGTYDYLDHQGHGDNLLPGLQRSDGEVLFSSDTHLGDVDLDGAPEMLVGRLPVLDAADVTAYTAKVEAYEEQSPGDPLQRLHLAVGEPAENADFTADSARLAGVVPAGYELTQLDLGALVLEDARLALFDGLRSGTSWLHYTGHGAPNRLSNAGLLTSTDVPTLGNSRTPVVSSVTCYINLFALPGYDGVGEFLVLEPAAGAAAVFAPVAASDHGEARFLGDRLFRRAFPRAGEDAGRLGDVLLDAFRDATAAGLPPELLHVYQLLGDPALLLRHQAAPEERTGTPSGPG